MRKLIFILLSIISFAAQSQVKIIGHYKNSTPTCPVAVTLTSTTNITESPTGTYSNSGNTAADGNAKITVSLPASTDGSLQADYVNSSNTYQVVLAWDVSNAIAESYHTTAQYVLFPFGDGNYWYNDNQGGATSTGIAWVDGDKFRLTRTGTTVKAQYYRGGSWSDLHTFAGSQSAQLFMFISIAQDGVILRVVNPMHCGGT
jgi:hypothetical protein